METFSLLLASNKVTKKLKIFNLKKDLKRSKIKKKSSPINVRECFMVNVRFCSLESQERTDFPKILRKIS